MKDYKNFKWGGKEGITAVIINDKKLLVLKRISFPFLIYSGLWLFPAGKTKGGEAYDQTSYREIFEETGLRKSDLKLISKYKDVLKIDKKRRIKYYNAVYVFNSKTKYVKLNMENTVYRWASFDDIKNQRKYTNVFADKQFIENVIRNAINGTKLAKA